LGLHFHDDGPIGGCYGAGSKTFEQEMKKSSSERRAELEGLALEAAIGGSVVVRRDRDEGENIPRDQVGMWAVVNVFYDFSLDRLLHCFEYDGPNTPVEMRLFTRSARWIVSVEDPETASQALSNVLRHKAETDGRVYVAWHDVNGFIYRISTIVHDVATHLAGRGLPSTTKGNAHYVLEVLAVRHRF
jgi:hypothetical protein